MGTCHRCGRSGHVARDCSLHTCFRCNGKGHMAWECVEGVTCGKCGQKGHLQRNCKHVSCHKCGRKGHIAKFCSDPFAKAVEVEKFEIQQALLSGRGSILDVPTGDGNRSFATKTVTTQKDMRGPWDGLGVNANDMEKHLGFHNTSCFQSEHAESSSSSSIPLVNSRKRLVSTSIQSVVSQRLRIKPCEKSDAVESLSCGIKTTKPHWNGLVDYGSEDSG